MKGRVGQQVAGSLVVVLVVAFVFRGELATAIMARAAERTLAAKRIAELPDGLHVVFCGAGSPLPDPRRSGPCVAVIAGRTLVVVDAGSNGVRNLQRIGFRPGGIRALFLTHFHSDHIDGLGELAMQRWVNAANTAAVVEQLAAAAPDAITVTDQHEDFAVLAVQGTHSDEVLRSESLHCTVRNTPDCSKAEHTIQIIHH